LKPDGRKERNAMRSMTRHALPVLLLLILLLGSARADKTILLTFTGDCTLGSEEKTREEPTSFDSVLAEKGTGWFFEYFRPMFEADDCTVINLEGVLSDSRRQENLSKTYRFRGPRSFVSVMSESSVEAVCLANNHAADYGDQGLNSTRETLEENGIGWFREENVWFFEKDGIRIAFVALDSRMYYNRSITLTRLVTSLKAEGKAQAVAVVYHNGIEYDAKHSGEQERMAQIYIDAGADLVIMHHPHVLQGIGILGNRTACYSLGNFVFGGNSQIRTARDSQGREATSLYTMAVQAEMHFSDDGRYLGQQLFLYPAWISGEAPANNYQPVPVKGSAAEQVMAAVQYDTSFMLPEISERQGLACVALPYLPADCIPDERME